MLSRRIAATLPPPLAIVSLHDPASAEESRSELRAAGGSRVAFCGQVLRLMKACTPETVVVCTHLHLAPAGRMLRFRAGRLVVVLCGIEAWVPLRSAEQWALSSADLVAISSHTAR